ncbi:hypothetical protein [Cellulomonas sp.]|nr:hypothetical protein [Cellulomonas sp.]
MASLAVIFAVWRTQLLLGVAIDVTLIVQAVVHPGCTTWVSG